MKINEVIRKYRKDGNLTQEQIANYLGVTAPAVNKWENGISFPDITLLAPLARILNIDMDTLFSFHEDLSDLEINQFIREISDLIQNDGYAAGFERGEALIKGYPNCDILRLYTADILKSYLIIKAVPNSESYENKIISWYEVVLTGKDKKIVDMAKTSLVTYHMNKGNYEKAQQQLDEIPSSGFDHRLTQAILYEKQFRFQEAYEIYETMLYEMGNQIISALQQICRLLSKEQKYAEAEKYAGLSSKIAELLDLGDYIAYTSNFLLAVEKKDKEQGTEMLAHMIDGIDTFEKFQDSKLYTHVKFNQENDTASMKKMLKDALKKDEELDFIRREPNAKRLFQRLEEQ